MRDSCLDCARKHLGQACINDGESRLGYPEYRWIAMAHLAEAEIELVNTYPEEAITIREHRKAYEADSNYIIPVIMLIRKLTMLDEQVQRSKLP